MEQVDRLANPRTSNQTISLACILSAHKVCTCSDSYKKEDSCGVGEVSCGFEEKRTLKLNLYNDPQMEGANTLVEVLKCWMIPCTLMVIIFPRKSQFYVELKKCNGNLKVLLIHSKVSVDGVQCMWARGKTALTLNLYNDPQIKGEMGLLFHGEVSLFVCDVCEMVGKQLTLNLYDDPQIKELFLVGAIL
ncbi:hypothetical protein SUGI_0359320 [Cryptomeria japonica]|nr:hypothetical protein SUGI_0359320 [Cryptomeria japonica]